MTATEPAFILYEYPFSERVRTLLRLEDLFEKLAFFGRQDHCFCHHAALLTLFEILEVTSRVDLRSDLVQELDRQRQALVALRGNPQVESGALEAVLKELDQSAGSLAAITGKAGQHLRDNDWLMNIRSRAIIPGGTCEFDLPSYHAWLMQATPVRAADLESWVKPLAPYAQGVAIVLKLLRETAQSSRKVATGGAFQMNLQGPSPRTFALLQVQVPRDCQAVPEISANKYGLWIRFTVQGADRRPVAFERDVAFELALCGF